MATSARFEKSFNLKTKKLIQALKSLGSQNAIFQEVGILIKSFLEHCADNDHCDELCIELITAFSDAFPQSINAENKNIFIRLNVYYLKLIALRGKSPTFLRALLVQWFCFLNALPTKTRNRIFLKAPAVKMLQMLFFKLQVSGDYFTQLKAVEILHLLLSSNDIGPEYLQLVAFIYPLIEVANLKVLFLKIEDNDQFFETSRSFLNYLNKVCKRDANTFSIKAKLKEINEYQLSTMEESWLNFDQHCLSVSFFALNNNLLEGNCQEAIRFKFVFIDDYELFQLRKTSSGYELIIIPKEHRIANSHFDKEMDFPEIARLVFLLDDSIERCNKFADFVSPRFIGRARLEYGDHFDTASVFSFKTVANSIFGNLGRSQLVYTPVEVENCDSSADVFTSNEIAAAKLEAKKTKEQRDEANEPFQTSQNIQKVRPLQSPQIFRSDPEPNQSQTLAIPSTSRNSHSSPINVPSISSVDEQVNRRSAAEVDEIYSVRNEDNDVSILPFRNGIRMYRSASLQKNVPAGRKKVKAVAKAPKVVKPKAVKPKAKPTVALVNSTYSSPNPNASGISKMTTVTTLNETQTNTIYSIAFQEAAPPIHSEYRQVSHRTSILTNAQENDSQFNVNYAIAKEREDFDFVKPIFKMLPFTKNLGERERRNEALFEKIMGSAKKANSNLPNTRLSKEKINIVEVPTKSTKAHNVIFPTRSDIRPIKLPNKSITEKAPIARLNTTNNFTKPPRPIKRSKLHTDDLNVLPQAKRPVYNLGMLQNPLMDQFLRATTQQFINNNVTSSEEEDDQMLPETDMTRAQPSVKEPEMPQEIEIIEDMDYQEDLQVEIPQVLREPNHPNSILNVTVQNSTYDLVRTTTESSESEKLENTFHIDPDLKDAIDLSFNDIMDMSKQKIAEIRKKPEFDTQILLDQMDQLKAFDKELKSYVSQYINLLKKAEVMKKNIFETELNSVHLAKSLSTSIDQIMIACKVHDENQLAELDQVQKHGVELINEAKKKAWNDHVDKIVEGVEKSIFKMYEI